MPDFKDFLCT